MIYADFAASGSTVHRRPQFSRMLTDAEDHQFDIIIAEDIDRLARGEGDAPKLRQRLEFLGIEIRTCGRKPVATSCCAKGRANC
jgi:site-specific DNA recombinase